MFDFAKKLLIARELKFEKGKIEILGQRLLLLAEEQVHNMIRMSIEDRNFRKSIYIVSKDALHKFTTRLRERYKLDKEKTYEIMCSLTALNGYGEVNFEKLDWDKKLAKFSTVGLPSEGLRGKIYGRGDAFFAGMVAGAMAQVFNDDTLEVAEIACVLSNSPKCIFVAAPREVLKREYPEIFAEQFWWLE